MELVRLPQISVPALVQQPQRRPPQVLGPLIWSIDTRAVRASLGPQAADGAGTGRSLSRLPLHEKPFSPETSDMAALNPRTLRLLRCPLCLGALTAEVDLRCRECGRVYPIVGGIPRMVIGSNESQVAKSFGFQWRWGRDERG